MKPLIRPELGQNKKSCVPFELPAIKPRSRIDRAFAIVLFCMTAGILSCSKQSINAPIVTSTTLPNNGGTSQSLPILRAPEWEGLNLPLLIRNSNVGSHDLLLKVELPKEAFRYNENTRRDESINLADDPSAIYEPVSRAVLHSRAIRPNPWQVYLYRPAKSGLQAVDGALWDQAKGTICNCDYPGPDPVPLTLSPINLEYRGDVLFKNGRLFPTAAEIVESVQESPSGKYVVVLSSSGKPRGGVIAFGSSATRGAHYSEVFSLPTMNAVCTPQKLPFAVGTIIHMCWSTDGRYLVYYEPYYKAVCIMPACNADE